MSDQQVRERGKFVPAVDRFVGEDTPKLVEGHGAVVEDERGNEYIDLFAHHGSLSLGYSQPAVTEAVVEQFGRLNHATYDFPTDPSIELTERLAEFTPGELEYSYFVNSGSEAVEVALSLARKATGNTEFISLGEAFHGRSYGARSLVGWKGYREDFGPFLSGVNQMPSFNCDVLPGDPETGEEYADLLEYVIEYQTGDVAAFIAEPMLGTAGNIPAPEGYFERIREICDDHGILFIADEVITGFGRTGERFGIEHYGVEPDIVTTAKALGGGMPIGATIATEEVARAFEEWDYFSTFGGHPAATAAGVATIDVIEDDRLVEASEEKGRYFLDRLRELRDDHAVIGDVRGRGLLLGVDLYEDGDPDRPLPKAKGVELRREAIDRGVILPAGQGWNGNTIRLSPPLVISEDQIDAAVDVIDDCLSVL